MGKSWIGASVRRKEDKRFLTGRGRYLDDIRLPGMLEGAVLRSPHAHAEIRSIDTADAQKIPGVRLVLTAADLEAADIGGLPCGWMVHFDDGRQMNQPVHAVLCKERVRHVGDPLAFVVADTKAIALDALEAITVDYAALPSVTELPKSVAPEAPQVWEEAPGNLCFDWHKGDLAAVEVAFAEAHHVTELRLVNNRLHAAPMETRGTIGDVDTANERVTLYTSNQNPHIIRVLMSIATLKIPEEQIRVVSPDVGGGFGMKIYHYAEEVLVVLAAQRLGRPVKWIAERSESFICDTHARDHVTEAAVALDEPGNVTALKVDTIANLGAYLSTFGPAIPTFFYANPMPGPYKTRAVHCRVRGVFTHSMPVDAYRGAGRPEATYVLERLMDRAAWEMGIDRVEFRRRNFIPAEAFPYQSPLLWTYDVGDFHNLLDKAMQMADYAGFEARRQEAKARGRLRGFGMAFYLEACGMGPSKMLNQEGGGAGQFEVAQVRVNPTGSVTVLTGSHTHGQGHETVFAQLVAESLGVDIERVQIVHGDTDRVPYGIGTYGSRSLAVGGSALKLSLDKVVEKGKSIAAHLMEADVADVTFEEGNFKVEGTDLSVDFMAVVGAAYNPANFPLDTQEPGLDETSYFEPPDFTYPFGCHLAEVEVDPETGRVQVCSLMALDDFGVQVNPLVVAGQIQGGLAQGVGQALLEHCRFDPESGQLLSGSFMDYCMPRADDLPGMTIDSLESPCRNNPLGVKGCGEAGAIAGPAAVTSGVLDALRPLGVTDLDMPLTPEVLWRACRGQR